MKIEDTPEDIVRSKERHVFAGELEKVAESVFKEVMYSQDLEELDEDNMTIMEMAQQ